MTFIIANRNVPSSLSIARLNESFRLAHRIPTYYQVLYGFLISSLDMANVHLIYPELLGTGKPLLTILDLFTNGARTLSYVIS